MDRVSTSAVAEKKDWDRAPAYFRNHVASAASASAASGSSGAGAAQEPLLWDARLELPQRLRPWAPHVEALAGDGPGWGHEQAAIAAAAFGSSWDGRREGAASLGAFVGSRC